jgi:DNA-directed RNA polymerase specialized sigma24 family protein
MSHAGISHTGSVTAWIGQLRAGEETALERLHARYWPRLVDIARKRLKGAQLRVVDEEDVAQQAFWSFFRTFKNGGVPRLGNRHELLALLTTITACTAINQIQHVAGVQKRGGERAAGVPRPAGNGQLQGFEHLVAAGKSPAEEAILHDTYRHFVESLPDRLRPVAELYLAGFTQHEISRQLSCGLRTVARKIALILAKWRALAAGE